MMYVGWQAATVQRSILGSLRRLSFPLEMFIRFLPQRSKSDFDSSQVIIWLALLEANFNEDKIDILIACAARYEGEMKERRKSENSNLKVDISKETWTNVWRI